MEDVLNVINIAVTVLVIAGLGLISWKNLINMLNHQKLNLGNYYNTKVMIIVYIENVFLINYIQ
jgi:hypothetical protein